MVLIRDYTPADERSWLRCRVLAQLDTAYFDDVATAKPEIPAPGFELVAVDGDDGDDGGDGGGGGADIVIGILDVTVEDDEATIDHVSVHPDHHRRGIGRALLALAEERARTLGAVSLSAFTRDTPGTLSWYRAMGFTDHDHYLHVYANWYVDAGEAERAVGAGRPGLRLKMAFLHADLAEEERMRREFSRVHVCRRFTKAL